MRNPVTEHWATACGLGCPAASVLSLISKLVLKLLLLLSLLEFIIIIIIIIIYYYLLLLLVLLLLVLEFITIIKILMIIKLYSQLSQNIYKLMNIMRKQIMLYVQKCLLTLKNLHI